MLKTQNVLPAARPVSMPWGERLARFVRRHPIMTFLVVFNAFGQALAFTPVIARSVYGVELNEELILVVAAVLFADQPRVAIPCRRRCHAGGRCSTASTPSPQPSRIGDQR